MLCNSYLLNASHHNINHINSQQNLRDKEKVVTSGSPKSSISYLRPRSEGKGRIGTEGEDTG